MSGDQGNSQPDKQEKDADTGSDGQHHIPSSRDEVADAGHTTGAAQAAANRESDPPA